jgi:hypothetical protein
MAVQSNQTTRTYAAGSDLSAAQYRFVDLAADDQIDVSTTAGSVGNALVGVLVNDPDAAGRASTVAVGGQTKIIAGSGGLSIGDLVTSDASGGAITAASTNRVVGVCTVAAAATETATIDLDALAVGQIVA